MKQNICKLRGEGKKPMGNEHVETSERWEGRRQIGRMRRERREA